MKISRKPWGTGWREIAIDDNEVVRYLKWSDGLTAYYDKDGCSHRTDGPAVIFSTGKREWWHHGKYIPCKTRKEFRSLIKLKAFW